MIALAFARRAARHVKQPFQSAILTAMAVVTTGGASLLADDVDSAGTVMLASEIFDTPSSFPEYLAFLNLNEPQAQQGEATKIDVDRQNDTGDFDRVDNDNDYVDREEIALGKVLVEQSKDDRVIEENGGRFVLPSLAAATTATEDVGNGLVPDSYSDNFLTPEVALPESGFQRAAVAGLDQWGWTTRTWTAPGTYSNPRYFEDRMLERHGHERWGYVQPLVSGARFFATVPMLPYLMAIEHPCECQSTLGFYRSGSCTPAFFQRPPWDRKALVAESVGMAAGLWIFP